MKCMVLSWGPESCQSSHKNIYFVYKPLEHCIWIYICLAAAPLCYRCFDCGRTYPALINLLPGLALLYLCVDFILTLGKSAQFF